MPEVEMTLSPFTNEPVPAPIPGVLADVASQREVAEVQAAMAIAKRFPRNQAQAADRILIACQRPSLAEGALYSYSRGGTEITGSSIRLAEAVAQQWGNIQFGIRELEQRYGESTVEAYAWDLETNTRQVKVFQVKHLRHTKKGSYALQDPRDIYEMVANQGARRLRACILGIIPGDVVESAVSQCESTLKASADISPEAVKKMAKVFAEIGVTREMLEKRIQRKLESIAPAQVIALRKIFNSLKDGMSTPADWFEVEVPAEVVGTQAERLKAKLGGQKSSAENDEPEPDKKKPGRPKASEKPATPPAPEAQPPGQGVQEKRIGDTVGPQAITPEQLAELDRVPLDIIKAAYSECEVDPTIALGELDESSARLLLEKVRSK